MTLCGGWSAVKVEQNHLHAITLWCRSWSCPDCGPARKRALIHRFNDGKPSTFITLTVRPREGETAAERAAGLARAWRVVVARARRKWPKVRIAYGAVFEHTVKGEPHLHILARAPYIPQKWLSEQLDELIGAPVVDIRAVRSARQVAAYVSKYVGKAPAKFGTSKRYWFTRDWSLCERLKAVRDSVFGSGWRAIHAALWIVVQDYEALGHTAVWSSDHDVKLYAVPP